MFSRKYIPKISNKDSYIFFFQWWTQLLIYPEGTKISVSHSVKMQSKYNGQVTFLLFLKSSQ